MTESFSGQIDTLKREADKYNKKTTEEWESQIDSLTKQREEEKTQYESQIETLETDKNRYLDEKLKLEAIIDQ